MPSPAKEAIGRDLINGIENRIQAAIYELYGIPQPSKEQQRIIKCVDLRVADMERQFLMIDEAGRSWEKGAFHHNVLDGRLMNAISEMPPSVQRTAFHQIAAAK
jgi:hypothetical protein